MNIRVDFHSHTSASKDSLTSPEEFVRVARRRGLGRIVVTDHNNIHGALAAQALDPELVIVGEEIMTTRGEILAFFVSEAIPAGLSPQETIRRLREQGAFISVSHPFDSLRHGSWSLEDLQSITPLVDALETFNARCMRPGANLRAQSYAQQVGLPGTAGSDAHAPFEVGRAALLLPAFSNARELRQVIRAGSLSGRASPLWVHFASRYASLRKMVV